MSDKPDLKIKKSYILNEKLDTIILKYEYGNETFRLPNKIGFKLDNIKITHDIYFAIRNYFFENIQLNSNYKILVTDEYVNFYNLDIMIKNGSTSEKNKNKDV